MARTPKAVAIPSGTIRYAENGNEYTLWVYGDRGTPVITRGLIDAQPKWLADIVAVARVGGHLRHNPNPPPDCLFWAEINSKRQLIEFTH